MGFSRYFSSAAGEERRTPQLPEIAIDGSEAVLSLAKFGVIVFCCKHKEYAKGFEEIGLEGEK